MHHGNMSQVVPSLKECPSENPKLNTGRRFHSGMNSIINYKEKKKPSSHFE